MHILLRPEDSEPAASPGPTGIGRAQRDDQSVWLPVSLRRFLRKQSMIVTTTPSIEGKRITRYCGVVAGEAILGANVFKDFFAGIRDIVGGRSGTYERELQKAREIALKELEQRAAEAGANAVVGVDLDFEVLGQGNGMLMVSASGTAVVVE